MEWSSLISTASTEVDSSLSLKYQTPIDASTADPDTKATAFWLANVTAQVAAGRFMLSAAAPGSQDQANGYGRYLIANAKALINDVLSGRIELKGAVEVVKDETDRKFAGPAIINGDRFSQVDAFYDNWSPEGIWDEDRVPRGRPWPV